MVLVSTFHPIQAATTSTNREEEAPDRINEDDGANAEEEVTGFARQLSRLSQTNNSDNVFDYQPGSCLDPFSEKFQPREWAQKLVHLATEENDQTTRSSGLSYRDLGVFGYGSTGDFQSTIGNGVLSAWSRLRESMGGNKRKVQILKQMDGVLEKGEMLMVLGPPGSGCSTLLKTIAGKNDGTYIDAESRLNYRGMTAEEMKGQFRGEAFYTAEVDVHFPRLTVGDTLQFAAEARAPRKPPGGLTQKRYAKAVRDVVMAILGIAHTKNTIVGNDYIRGISGGERKRVTIAEAILADAPLYCWDNSTRGLDSASSVQFVKTLRLSADYFGFSSVVAIYQAPMAAYEVFHKVCLLYEGEQIYFGPTGEAKRFFVDMGFDCPSQQTTPDFLTSLTSPSERKVRPGFEGQVPTNAMEFVRAWKSSETYRRLLQDIERFEERHPTGSDGYDRFLHARRAQQSRQLSSSSPYTISYPAQVKLCVRRGFKRLLADLGDPLTQLFANFSLALVGGSIFYNMQPNTDSFFARAACLFVALFLNAFSSEMEVLTLYAQRPIVEKHTQYAFYHPSAEALSSTLCDLPYKIINAICFNTTIYFLANLRREAGAFFYFLFFNILLVLVMSSLFRCTAAVSRSLAQALAPLTILLSILAVYAGFAIPSKYMLGWAKWIWYINPLAYAFESLMINEFHGRDFTCSQLVPDYPGISSSQQVCNTVGTVPRESIVSGSVYIQETFSYVHSHKWRNVGIILAFIVVLTGLYLRASEIITAEKSRGEVLVFPRGKVPETQVSANDEEAQGRSRSVEDSSDPNNEVQIERQTSVFSWSKVTYDVQIKKETRRLLDHVDGYVKPGTLTALMGVSGAGKTTLLDVLATRTTMGVVGGDMLVDGQPRDISFQRNTGYVQQQDVHLENSTVREAFRFSAKLRRPASVPLAEKYAYCEQVIDLLEMRAYADAVVGVPGTGLNVEQRKRLTIGVELVAKPGLLLFLDEPTSGLDSQTSWNILMLLRRLTDHGQAILCTIHQPSAILFEQFDRLLFLAKGGRTVYFGPVGKESRILIDYFERNGAVPYTTGENPAEYMLKAIGATRDATTDVDWHQAWLNSNERQEVQGDIARLGQAKVEKASDAQHHSDEYAVGFWTQFTTVFWRTLKTTYRSPKYFYSKALLCCVTSLITGFSIFQADSTQQGLQTQLFGVFIFIAIYLELCQQVMPEFYQQRQLYETRERPSKIYSWKAFILANVISDIPWSILVASATFFCIYYPVGFYRHAVATDSVAIRGFLFWLYTNQFLMFTSTFAIAVLAGFDSIDAASGVVNLVLSLSFFLCGVLLPYAQLPAVWQWVNRTVPFTYLVKGLLGVGLANDTARCSDTELLRFQPTAGQTCGEYMTSWITDHGGYVIDERATSGCGYCSISTTNDFLARFDILYSNRWRDFGIFWAYIVFNIGAAIFLYWLIRVKRVR